MINVNWPRWIKASVANHFNNNLDNVYMYVEGEERKREEPNNRFELRMDGPDINDPSDNYFVLDLSVNLLIRILRSNDNYKLERMKGTGTAAFTGSIDIYKYGTDADVDDQSLLGCMDRVSNILVVDFGLVESPSNVIYATIESTYQLIL